MRPEDNFIYTPPDAAKRGLEYFNKRRNDNHWDVPLYLDNFDKVPTKYRFTPMHRNELVALIMQPGHGKTSFMTYHARRRATDERVLRAGNRAVVYVSVEQTVEEMYALTLASEVGLPTSALAMGTIGDEDWDKVGHYSMAKAPEVPIWYIGRSADNEKIEDSLDVKISVPFIKRCLMSIRNWTPEYKFVLDMIYIDHLQELEFDKSPGFHDTKVNRTTENVHNLKKLSLLGPIMMAVQARREVSSYKDRLPNEGDGQWTSGIEQITDGVLAGVYPRKFMDIGDTYDGLIVTENLWKLVVWKRRFGPPNLSGYQHFDPTTNTFTSLAVKRVDLNEEANKPGTTRTKRNK